MLLADLSCIVQVLGYIFRALGHGRTDSIPIYALQTVFILLAPPFYAASIYMVLGRLVRYLQAESLSLLPVRWITKIFVTADVISFLTQSTGMLDKCIPVVVNSWCTDVQ